MKINLKINFKLIELLSSVKKSTLIKSSGIYTVASFFNAAIPFLLLPYLTSILSQNDFGIITMFTSVLGFVIPFVSINTDAAIARKFYNKDVVLPVYVGNSLLIITIGFLVILLMFIFLQDYISIYTGIPYLWLLLIPFVAFSKTINSILLTLWQVRQKALFYGLYQILITLTNLGFTFIFIYYAVIKWEGRLTAIVLSFFLFSFFSFFILLKNKDVKFKINTSYLKHSLKFGGGLIPHSIGAMLIMVTNRLFLTRMIGLEEAGLYGVASQVCSAIVFITIPFNNAFVPWFYGKLSLNDKRVKQNIVKITYVYFSLLIIGGFFYYSILPFIFNFFIDSDFSEAIKYSPWIISGFVFQGMYFMVTNYITYIEKTHIQASITITIGLLNLLFNYIFIFYFGSLGAAMALSLSYFLFFIVTWFYSSRLYKMPWNILKKQQH